MTAALLIFVPPVGVVVMLVWGFKLAKAGYELELEPKLRKRFIDQEAEKLVHASLSRQRRDLEGVHAKSLEQLSASIAHEIRNPITAAKSLVQQMGETRAPNGERRVRARWRSRSSSASSGPSRTCSSFAREEDMRQSRT